MTNISTNDYSRKVRLESINTYVMTNIITTRELSFNKKNKLTSEQKLQICRRYIEGESCESLSRTFNVWCGTVVRLLKRNNIQRRDHRTSCSRYKFNHTFFTNIDTEAKAYFIGFVLADGCVRRDCLTIQLHQQDTHILEYFISCIEGDCKLYSSKQRNGDVHPVLKLSSLQMITDLKQHGIIENKTYNLTTLPVIPEHLERHFWRGVMDGDGCVYLSKDKKQFQAFICNYLKHPIDAFESFLHRNNIETRGIIKYPSVYNITLCNKYALKFLNLIYKDSDPKLCLKRKHAKYQEYLEHKISMKKANNCLNSKVPEANTE